MSKNSVLILEDEAIIAMDMEMMLEDNGYSVLGPCSSVDVVRQTVADLRPDIAVLDVNLGRGKTSFEFAEEMQEMGIPLLFLSGYSEAVVQVPQQLSAAERLMKPVLEGELLAAILREEDPRQSRSARRVPAPPDVRRETGSGG